MLIFFITFSVFIRTDASCLHIPSTDYLIAFRERGIFHFHPETTVDSPQGPQPISKGNTQIQLPTDLPGPFWPDTNCDDACSISPSDQPTEFVGLGFKFDRTIPDCPTLEESAYIVRTY